LGKEAEMKIEDLIHDYSTYLQLYDEVNLPPQNAEDIDSHDKLRCIECSTYRLKRSELI
jgi:hypothetical protein